MHGAPMLSCPLIAMLLAWLVWCAVQAWSTSYLKTPTGTTCSIGCCQCPAKQSRAAAEAKQCSVTHGLPNPLLLLTQCNPNRACTYLLHCHTQCPAGGCCCPLLGTSAVRLSAASRCASRHATRSSSCCLHLAGTCCGLPLHAQIKMLVSSPAALSFVSCMHSGCMYHFPSL